MAATYIHLVRHAQGLHNISKENETIQDPDLTPLGEQQCATLRDNFPHHGKTTHLVASPMRRTMRTCLLAFAPEVEAGKKVIALPELQELSPLPCDTGSDPAVLAGEFDASKVDLSLVKEGWNDKSPGGPWEPTSRALGARAKKARVWLRDLAAQSRDGGQQEVHIVVVSHGGVLHFLTDDWDGMDSTGGACKCFPGAGRTTAESGYVGDANGVSCDQGTGWANMECRTYEFADPSGKDENAGMKESPPSWRSRRGSAIPPTEAEQRQLKAVVVKNLDEALAELPVFEPQKGTARQ